MGLGEDDESSDSWSVILATKAKRNHVSNTINRSGCLNGGSNNGFVHRTHWPFCSAQRNHKYVMGKSFVACTEVWQRLVPFYSTRLFSCNKLISLYHWSDLFQQTWSPNKFWLVMNKKRRLLVLPLVLCSLTYKAMVLAQTNWPLLLNLYPSSLQWNVCQSKHKDWK